MTRDTFPLGLPQPSDPDWTYVLDDNGITYGPGCWPFCRTPHTNLALSPPSTPQPTPVRVSPSFAFHAWRTEYIGLNPLPGGLVLARLHLIPAGTIPPPGDTAYTATLNPARQHIDLRHIPRHLCDLAIDKLTRIQAFLLTAINERDNGATRPTTAIDLEAARRNARAQTTTTG
ncbi:hypothetical protein [Polymorphospora sp. NPDC050346]|uniref:hypothetical protein n=1 Tax=Polymorphospora sp. NPDC050346 TaxID=3155780 RepID=UPI0033CAC85A